MQRKEKRKKAAQAAVRKVRCRNCRNFVRDTAGISFSLQSGEFFMGRCLRGRNSPYKVFMDEERVCGEYRGL